jgi:hypothetical protein
MTVPELNTGGALLADAVARAGSPLMTALFNATVRRTSSGGSSYEASPIKRRRATKAEVGDRRAALYEIVKAMRPMTVRQVFYQATVRDLVEKTEAGYTKVQTDLVQMRKSGQLPYDWLADNTRWQRKPTTFSSIEQALGDTARLYRKALWADAASYVEIWLERTRWPASSCQSPASTMFR